MKNAQNRRAGRPAKALACAALCAGLVLSMAACENTENSSLVSSEAPSAPSSSAPASSMPESSESAPSSDGPVSSESPSTGAEDFEAAFSQNPIDQKFDDDYSVASSFTMMRKACDTAAKSWKNMIDTSYREALETVSGEERTKLQEEQDQWADELDGKIEQLRADAGDSDEGVLESSRQIVQLYRERAMALCKAVYEATGELPAFETAPADDGTPQG